MKNIPVLFDVISAEVLLNKILKREHGPIFGKEVL
jgi:hypothetical protein